MLKVTTRYVVSTRIKDANRIVMPGGSWHASSFWVTGVASTEAMAAVQLAKCFTSSSKCVIAIRYSKGIQPPKYCLEYMTSVRYKGLMLLQYNICSYTGSLPPKFMAKELENEH